jgi:DNA-binding FadR family transcriptional regulator
VLAAIVVTVWAVGWMSIKQSEDGTRLIIEIGKIERAVEQATDETQRLLRKAGERIEKAFEGQKAEDASDGQ